MRIIVLTITAIFIIYSILKRKYFKLTTAQTIIMIVYALACSQIFNRIIYFISYGEWGGHFFYGALICMPLYMIPLVYVMKLNYLRAMDHIALAAIFIESLGKLDCAFVSHCCGGCYIESLDAYFPSRLVEISFLLCIGVVIFKISKNPQKQGVLFGWLFILYGIERMVMDYFRLLVPELMFGIVRPATFWCSLCVIWGIFWVIFVPKTKSCQQLREDTILYREQLAEKMRIDKIRKQKQKQAKQKSK